MKPDSARQNKVKNSVAAGNKRKDYNLMSTITKQDKIYVAGHRGLVGSAIVRSLKRQGYTNIIGRTHKELDLIDQAAVKKFFEEEKPDVVVLAAAKSRRY